MPSQYEQNCVFCLLGAQRPWMWEALVESYSSPVSFPILDEDSLSQPPITITITITTMIIHHHHHHHHHQQHYDQHHHHQHHPSIIVPRPSSAVAMNHADDGNNNQAAV